MAQIYIGLGSNVERERNLLAGIADLHESVTEKLLANLCVHHQRAGDKDLKPQSGRKLYRYAVVSDR